MDHSYPKGITAFLHRLWINEWKIPDRLCKKHRPVFNLPYSLTFQQKIMKKKLFILISVISIAYISCKKDNDTTDAKSKFTGDWAGGLIYDGTTDEYRFGLKILSDNSVVNIDSAFGNQVFPGSFTYTDDSINITYDNGTKWRMKFANNYSSCQGRVLGFSGSTGNVVMTKK